MTCGDEVGQQVGGQAVKARVDALEDVGFAWVCGRDFRSKENGIATSLRGLAEDCFGAVGFCGVDEQAAGIEAGDGGFGSLGVVPNSHSHFGNPGIRSAQRLRVGEARNHCRGGVAPDISAPRGRADHELP